MNQISATLPRFKKIGPSKWSFRCVVCGDSEKNTRKARGGIYDHKGTLLYNCFNCGYCKPFGVFLKEFRPEVYTEYRLDCLKERPSEPRKEDPTPSVEPHKNVQHRLTQSLDSPSLADLPTDHPAVQYLRGRKVPDAAFGKVLFTDNFQRWVLKHSPLKKYADRKLPEDSRILFPFKLADGTLIGAQGRVIDKASSKPRYISIKFDDDSPRLFGIESVNRSRPIFVVEGPIDSLFLPNAVAMCGGDFPDHIFKDFDKDHLYVVFDNEPRHKDTLNRMKAAIESGYRVCFWSISPDFKDINQMVDEGGFSVRDILSDIYNNSAMGLKAQAKFMHWKKRKN